MCKVSMVSKVIVLQGANEACTALHRLRDSLFSELRDLNKTRPRGKADENLVAEINRLESALLIAKDDLVSCALRLGALMAVLISDPSL